MGQPAHLEKLLRASCPHPTPPSVLPTSGARQVSAAPAGTSAGSPSDRDRNGRGRGWGCLHPLGSSQRSPEPCSLTPTETGRTRDEHSQRVPVTAALRRLSAGEDMSSEKPGNRITRRTAGAGPRTQATWLPPGVLAQASRPGAGPGPWSPRGQQTLHTEGHGPVVTSRRGWKYRHPEPQNVTYLEYGSLQM